MSNESAQNRCSVRVGVGLASASLAEKKTHTWLCSFAHKDVDNAAAGDLTVQTYQFISNTEGCEGDLHKGKELLSVTPDSGSTCYAAI